MGLTEDEMLEAITDKVDMNLSKLRQIKKVQEACCAEVFGVAKSQTWLSNWRATTVLIPLGIQRKQQRIDRRSHS